MSNKRNARRCYVAIGVVVIIAVVVAGIITWVHAGQKKNQEEQTQESAQALVMIPENMLYGLQKADMEIGNAVNGVQDMITAKKEAEEAAKKEEEKKAQAEKDAKKQASTKQSDHNQGAQTGSGDFVENLSIATRTNQLIIVSASGTTAKVTMHEKNESGSWTQIMSTSGYVGSQGVGQASESSSRTPAGSFTFGKAFGVNANPGSNYSYVQVDGSHYWVDDPASAYYNKFVSSNEIPASNWSSAEHIIDYPTQYAYVLSIDYNTACTPGAGSAIFLHCSNGRPTAGCVSIPQSDMIFVMQHIQSGCRIVIDTESNISKY